MKKVEPVRLVAVDPDVLEFIGSMFSTQSPEEILATLEEMLESGEYTYYELQLFCKDYYRHETRNQRR